MVAGCFRTSEQQTVGVSGVANQQIHESEGASLRIHHHQSAVQFREGRRCQDGTQVKVSSNRLRLPCIITNSSIHNFFSLIYFFCYLEITSRGRPKSAPYLRLKIARGLQSGKVFSSTSPEKPKSWTELALRGDHLGLFNIHF